MVSFSECLGKSPHKVTLEEVELIFEFEIFMHHPQSKTSLCSKVIPHDSVDALRDFEFTFELYSRLLSELKFLVEGFNYNQRPAKSSIKIIQKFICFHISDFP